MHNVFIVDDEPFIIEGMHHIVDWSAYGMQIVGYAYDGAQALEALRQQPVDLLITDISMPKMNGLDLIRSIRPEQPDLKIIILSGYNEFDYLKEGMKYGIENYLLKPVNVAELKETLQGTADKLGKPPLPRFADNDIGILRDNILYRWMVGRITHSELQGRAELLKFPVQAPYYLAALWRGAAEEADAFAPLLEAAQRQDPAGSRIVVFRDFAGDAVTLFALSDDGGPDRERAERWLEQQLELPELAGFSLTIGDVQPAAEQAGLSYTQAAAAQDYFLVRPGSRLIRFGDLPDEEGRAAVSFAWEWPQYVNAVHARDRQRLRELAAADVDRLTALEGAGPSDVRQSVVELLVLFRSELKLAPESGVAYQEAMDLVGRAASASELTEQIVRVADLAIDGMGDHATSPVVQQVLHRVHESCEAALSLKSLGQELKVHPVYLGQLFHKETGHSFTEYLNRYRIERAKQLLVEGNYKVQEIAQMVGYMETGYFYKKFKKYVGVSPMDYRELRE